MPEADDRREANKALVLKFMHAAHVGDRETMLECMTEDYEQIFPRPGVPGFPSGIKGRDQLLEFLDRLPVYDRSTMKMHVEKIIAEGDIVAIQFRMNATTARGEDYENYYVQFVECDDGRIARCWEYADTLYAAKKLAPDALNVEASA